MRRIDCILFDLGETLLHFGTVEIPRLFEAGAQLAYQYLKDLGFKLPEFRRYHRKKLFAIRWSYLLSRVTRREIDTLGVLDKLHRDISVQLTDEQAMKLASLWYEPLSKEAKIEPTAIETLEHFKARGIRLGLVSNTFIPAEVLDRHLERENLLPLLPVRVYSCQSGLRKPNQAIFRAALEKIQMEPDRTAFVGDSLKADVHGANKMGMVSVLIDPASRSRVGFYKPDYTIRRLEELKAIVDRHNSSAN